MLKRNGNNGITLIALIITITIIIILASASVAVFRNSGIISKSKLAGNSYQNKINEEKQAMQNYASTMNEYTIADSGRDDTITIKKEEYESLLNRVNELENANNYSTEEIKIGKWIDGKNIYRKLYNNIDCTPTSNSWIKTSINNKNIDRIINGKLAQNSSEYASTSLLQGSFFAIDSEGNVMIWGTPAGAYTFQIIMLEYTKNTDTETK